MEQFKIEKNVPLFGNGNPPKYPFDKMEVGDSFLVPCGDVFTEKVRSKVIMAAHNYKKKFNLPDVVFKSALQGKDVRIWRVK